jgi:hypothetical protein
MTTPPAGPSRIAVPRGTVVRFGAAAVLAAALLYVVVFWEPQATMDPTEGPLDPPIVSVPQLDHGLLRQAKDATREDRLFLEQEPLSHLLASSLNVSEEAGRALGMPAHMVPIDELRADPQSWRGRWLFYRGKVEDLTGPRQGHPVPGYGIYEAVLRLQDGGAVMFTFSHPPGEGVRVGGHARAEGYLLKLRDVAFPMPLEQAPLLVGARLREDYADWKPVTALDEEQLAHIVDTHKDGDRIEPSPDSWRSIDEDQSFPLWHLGAYARDGGPRTLEEWRRIAPLNAQETWEAFKRDEVARGTPMRVLGMLSASRSIAARPNPAGITDWTEAWVQVRDLGGKIIPIWVPKAATAPLGSMLEVRAYYLRRYAYTAGDKQYWTPLFVAADLDPYVFDTGAGMREIGMVALPATLLLLGFVIFSQRRERRRSLLQEDALIARRRRRRTRPETPAVEAP